MIAKGESYTFETLKQFQNRLNVDNSEIVDALSDDEQESLVDAYSDLRDADAPAGTPTDDEEWPSAKTTEDLPDWAINDWTELIQVSTNAVVISVLKERDGIYTHTRSGPIHRVIEITDTRLKQNGPIEK